MQYLYLSSVPDFNRLVASNAIAEKVRDAYYAAFSTDSGDAQFRAWTNSLAALSKVLEGRQFEGTHVFLEFKMPLTSSRCDVLLVGKDVGGNSNAVVLELKQWGIARESTVRDSVSVMGQNRLHPSAQVQKYCQ